MPSAVDLAWSWTCSRCYGEEDVMVAAMRRRKTKK
jgi:hypothetical protein